ASRSTTRLRTSDRSWSAAVLCRFGFGTSQACFANNALRLRQPEPIRMIQLFRFARRRCDRTRRAHAGDIANDIISGAHIGGEKEDAVVSDLSKIAPPIITFILCHPAWERGAWMLLRFELRIDRLEHRGQWIVQSHITRALMHRQPQRQKHAISYFRFFQRLRSV